MDSGSPRWVFFMKRLAFYLLLFGCVAASDVREAEAQGTQDALTFSTASGSRVDGYAPEGVGWSFIPTADLYATGIEASAPQLSFWQGSNQVLATFDVPSPSILPSGSFTPIAPVFLASGQLYFISCQYSNYSSGFGLTLWGLQGAGGLHSFTPSPYLSQFASYYVSATGQWTSSTIPSSSNGNYFLYGPNFQFQLVPEPASFGLLLVGFLFCIRKPKSPA
jgi:hypothetical protein